jgi:glycosyltransferase involved in cell wall biosynthesis
MHVLISALHRPTKPTGVCRYAVNLAQCLVETEKVTKVTLLVGAWQREYFETAFNLESDKINLISVEIKNSSLSRNLWFLLGLPKLANRLRPDIVHLSFPMPFVRSLFRSPVVATIHDLYPYECPENFGYPNALFNRWFLKQCINNSDGLSCVSQMTLKHLQYYFPNVCFHKDTTVVYNTVDFSQVMPSIPQNITFSSFLLCVAQHRKNKNLDVLIQSYYQLRQNRYLSDETKLVIVGSNGPETKNLLALIQSLALEDRIFLWSSIGDRELRWLYENCELFVIPSSTEGFCLPLAEAIDLSCKVVCSDIPIFREIGSHRCTYFNLGEDRVSNLQEAIAQSLGSHYSNCSKDSRFSKKTAATQYLQFYSTIKN